MKSIVENIVFVNAGIAFFNVSKNYGSMHVVIFAFRW